jgi:hypothetical protein
MEKRTIKFIAEVPLEIDQALRAEAARERRSRKAQLAFILEQRYRLATNGGRAPEAARTDGQSRRRVSP